MNEDLRKVCVDDHPGSIAIIGMAGRFPGSRNLEELRRNLERGIEAIRPLSDQELLDAGVDPDLLTDPNYVKAAAVFEDADKFDAAFFEYSPREAAIMDPQQRLFIECAWEALEDAGRAGESAGHSVGVFSGAGGNMSTYLLSDVHFNPRLTGTTASMEHIGNDKDYLSTRVSYKFDFRGPSYTVQTACSTSLVAIHLACKSLIHGECEMALAGGVTVRFPQKIGYLYKEGSVFSPDGHCRAFDAQAGGTVFGSGVGVVVLKRLKDAIEAGDAIHAVIRGSAITNDGANHKTSYWAPNAYGQAEAMRNALAAAQVAPETIGYVEAHGTATKVGDPTELQALGKAFGNSEQFRCAVGSIKSNIGHPESAAGVAGLIKAVLSVKHKTLFPTLHYSQPNPRVDTSNSSFYISNEKKHWEEQDHPRRAGVNSLGIGGTNAFLVVEEAPEVSSLPPSPPESQHILTLSAKTPKALEELVSRYQAYFEQETSDSFRDICFTSNVGRKHFRHRIALIASSVANASTQLGESRQQANQLARGIRDGHTHDGVAFLFTGQGSQYVNMGRELYQTQQTFRETLDRCAQLLENELEQPLLEVLFSKTDDCSTIDQTAYTQPALFAFEYALAALWRSWGIKPAVLMGHSVGEIVAACVAGVMSLEDAIKLIALRGRLMQTLPLDGAMVSVNCDPRIIGDKIAAYPDEVSIAAFNGPSNVVLSGRKTALESIVASLDSETMNATWLPVSHAFHSPLMEPIRADFENFASTIQFSPPEIPLVSNVTGEMATEEVATPEYWVQHIFKSVRFSDGMRTLADQDVNCFLEIGPRPTLLSLGSDCIPTGERAWLPSLRRGKSEWQQVCQSLAELYVRGTTIDWNAFHQGEGCRRVHLPTYPFQRKRFWMDAAEDQTGSRSSVRSSLLGNRLRLPLSGEIRFETQWEPNAPAYLTDHRIFSEVVVPGASHIAMVLSAVRKAHGHDSCVIEDVLFPNALMLPEGSSRQAQLVISPGESDKKSFRVLSLLDGEEESDPNAWQEHAVGTLQLTDPLASIDQRNQESADQDVDAKRFNLPELKKHCTREASAADFYARFWDAGYHLGPSFQWISEIWGGDAEVLCRMKCPDLPDDIGDYPLYPSLIDACFQFLFSDRAQKVLNQDAVFVPFHIGRFEFYRSPDPTDALWCHAKLSEPDESSHNRLDADITLFDESGQVIARLSDCQLREANRNALIQQVRTDLRDAAYELVWESRVRSPLALEETQVPGCWLILAEQNGNVGQSLIDSLQSEGQYCVRVDHGSRYKRISDDHYQVNATEPDDLLKLFKDVQSATKLPWRGIVHLWSLDARIDDPADDANQQLVCGSVLRIVQVIGQIEWAKPPGLWLITGGSQPAGAPGKSLNLQQTTLWGLGSVISLEHPELKCKRIDLDSSSGPDNCQQLFDDLWLPDDEDQIAYRGANRYVARVVASSSITSLAREESDPLQETRPFKIKLSSYGQFENLSRQPVIRRPPGPGEVEIEVQATGLNFRDVLNVLGMLQAHYAESLGVTSVSDMTFGFECSGRIAALGEGVSGLSVGDEVIGTATHDALGSHVTLRREFVVPKPATLDFAEAASLPLPFLTAYYGLHSLAQIQPGDRVLIHSAAGGVGQAAVQIAQMAGAEIYATASPSKWEHLRAIGIKHVMSSRTLDFADDIKRLTDQEGVDVVLNTLSGDYVEKSFEILKHGGRFVELGKLNVWSEEEAKRRRPDVSYFPFDLVEVSQRDPDSIQSMLLEMTDRVNQGDLSPLRHSVFPVSDVADAFRFMAEAKHIGKIVISMTEVGNGQTPSTIKILPTSTYLITGGLGALGLKVAELFVANGARHLVLTGRRGAVGETQSAVEKLKQSGAEVLVVKADIANANDALNLMTRVKETLPPLRGIVHAAGVLDDGVLLHQTWERFRKVMKPKVQGAWNLHSATLGMKLDFFVGFSSVASFVGNAGQGSYACGNAFIDALAHYRQSQGLAGLSINWGPWGQVGMAAAMDQHGQRRLAEQGFRTIDPDLGMQAFFELLRKHNPQVAIVPGNWSKFALAHPSSRPLLTHVAAHQESVTEQESGFKQQLAGSSDPRRLLMTHIRTVVSRVLGVDDPDSIDPRSRLFDLGLESLMAVELRSRFEQSLECSLRSSLLFDYPTIESLSDYLAQQVIDCEAEVSNTSVAEVQSPIQEKKVKAIDELQELTDDDIAARLAKELSSLTREDES